MSTSVEIGEARIRDLKIRGDRLAVLLEDGRKLDVPLDWYPRLLHATPAEKANRSLIAQGRGIHWFDLDEDISVENLLAGKRSTESPKSFSRWLEGRKAAAAKSSTPTPTTHKAKA